MLDFDGTFCDNKKYHELSYVKALSMYNLNIQLPNNWFGKSTHDLFSNITSNKDLIKKLVIAKQNKMLEYSNKIVPNAFLSQIVKQFYPHIKFKIFTNGSKDRISNFMKLHNIKIDVISAAEYGLKKESVDTCLKLIDKTYLNENTLLIDDNKCMIPVASKIGIKFVHFNNSETMKKEIYEFLNPSCR